MTDYQQIVDEIRSALTLGDDCPNEVIVTLNEQYIEAVRSVNERLRMCRDLLARGQRSEMIRQCNAEPKLMEAVCLLDAPKQLSWDAVVCRLGLPALPELLIDTALEVNEAFMAEQPLEGLLRSHRLLALARAPLRQRIGLLRRIATAEPDNPLWKDDLREYEKVRLGDISEDLSVARRQRNLESLAQIEQELRSIAWLQPPPPGLVSQAVTAYAEINREAARRELGSLVEPLNLAFASLDVALARELRAKWNAAAATAGLDEYDELADAAAPALQWLQAEDRRVQGTWQAAPANLEVEETRDDGALHGLSVSVEPAPHHPGVDRLGSLADRVASLFRVGTARTSRKRWWLGLLLIAMAAAAALLPYRYVRSQRIEMHAVALDTLLREEKLDEAQQYVKKLKDSASWILDAPRMKQLVGRLDHAVLQEDDRRAGLDRCFKNVQKLMGEIIPGGNAPANWQALTSAQGELNEAASDVRTDDERATVKRLSRRLAEIREELESKEDSAARR